MVIVLAGQPVVSATLDSFQSPVSPVPGASESQPQSAQPVIQQDQPVTQPASTGGSNVALLVVAVAAVLLGVLVVVASFMRRGSSQ